jgi:hypothetical protein
MPKALKKDIREGMKIARHDVGEQASILFGTTESENDEELGTRFIEGNIKSRAKVYSTIEGRAKIFLQSCKRSATKRQQIFDLKIADIVTFWNKQNKICEYSGVEMTLEAGKLNTVSIERIDSSVGYTKENTVLVCNIINRMKSDFQYEDFYLYCSNVAKFLGDEELKLTVGAYK